MSRVPVKQNPRNSQPTSSPVPQIQQQSRLPSPVSSVVQNTTQAPGSHSQPTPEEMEKVEKQRGYSREYQKKVRERAKAYPELVAQVEALTRKVSELELDLMRKNQMVACYEKVLENHNKLLEAIPKAIPSSKESEISIKSLAI